MVHTILPDPHQRLIQCEQPEPVEFRPHPAFPRKLRGADETPRIGQVGPVRGQVLQCGVQPIALHQVDPFDDQPGQVERPVQKIVDGIDFCFNACRG